VIVEGLGVLVTGGPSKVVVFRIYQRPQLWFAVPAQEWIAGFAVHQGLLYVQDGPVLSAWNLVTKARELTVDLSAEAAAA